MTVVLIAVIVALAAVVVYLVANAGARASRLESRATEQMRDAERKANDRIQEAERQASARASEAERRATERAREIERNGSDRAAELERAAAAREMDNNSRLMSRASDLEAQHTARMNDLTAQHNARMDELETRTARTLETRMGSWVAGEGVRIHEEAEEHTRVLLGDWKIESEDAIRRDAIAASVRVVKGKVVEHLVPYMGQFPFDPRDCRFVGAPIDMVVFDGLYGDGLREVVFLEIKTGKSQLNPRERSLRDAIRAGKVRWEQIRVANPGTESSVEPEKERPDDRNQGVSVE